VTHRLLDSELDKTEKQLRTRSSESRVARGGKGAHTSTTPAPTARSPNSESDSDELEGDDRDLWPPAGGPAADSEFIML
jgi:hypothetical protein